MEFFCLYGTSFNYFVTGVSLLEGGQYFPKRARILENGSANPSNNRSRGFNNNKNTGNINGLLYIENPDTPDIDMGKNSFLLPKIKRAFEHAYQLLTVTLADESVESYLSYVIRTDDPLLTERLPDLSSLRTNADIINNP